MSKKELRALEVRIQEFVAAHPGGWYHDDFERLVSETGLSAGQLGVLTERQRIVALLSPVKGLGPRRIGTLVERYGATWDLAGATVEELASLPSMNARSAAQVHRALAPLRGT